MTKQEITQHYHQFALEQLPVLEKEVNDLIDRKEKRKPVLACMMQLVQVLTELGVGQELEQKLKNYYNTIH